MKIAYSQFKVKDIHTFEEFCAHIEQHVKRAAQQGAQMILFPEFCTAELLTMRTCYDTTDPGEILRDYAQIFTDRLHDIWRALASTYQISITAGTHFHYIDSEKKYYNTAYVYGKGGEFFEQSKTHISYELVYNKDITTPGDALHVFELDGVHYGIAICYDNSFPQVAQKLAAQGAEVILAPSCCLDEWGKNRNILFAKARATENLAYVVGAHLTGRISFPPDNPYGFLFTGQSGIYAPMNINFGSEDGILAQSHSNQDDVVCCELDLDVLRRARAHASHMPVAEVPALSL